MTFTSWVMGKFHAARTLYRMIRYLSNWSEVWSAYRASRSIPPLRFRSGLMLHHGRHDSPIGTLHEVFGDRQYRRHLVKPSSGVLIDLGANIGAVTVDLARGSSSLRVHAYEPNPDTNSILRQNITVNSLSDRVTVYDEAVGREQGEMLLWTNTVSMGATGYRVPASQTEGATLRVPLIDLNEVVKRAGGGPVALLKMDTEGAEVDTLEGADPATLDAIDQVVLEYHETLCPDAMVRCQRVLERAGFHCRTRTINSTQGLIYARR